MVRDDSERLHRTQQADNRRHFSFLAPFLGVLEKEKPVPAVPKFRAQSRI